MKNFSIIQTGATNGFLNLHVKFTPKLNKFAQKLVIETFDSYEEAKRAIPTLEKKIMPFNKPKN